jgi:enoyl-CoA hydratase
MENDIVLLDVKGGVCLLTMNHPKTLNALSDVTIGALLAALDKIEGDDSIRVVIFTGSGKSFVAGADIAYMANMTAEEGREFSRYSNRVNTRIAASDKIFIAAVNGYALGGGCEIALSCDLIIASEYARFGLPEVSLGIVPGAGGTQRLPRLVGIQKAAEMVLTGLPVKAQEALEIGLVCRVVPADQLLDCAREIAAKILKNAPLAVKYAKKCLRQSRELTLAAGLEYENTMFGLCFATPGQKEGMAAFLEKREARFQPGL